MSSSSPSRLMVGLRTKSAETAVVGASVSGMIVWPRVSHRIKFLSGKRLHEGSPAKQNEMIQLASSWTGASPPC
eukprot:1160137-Pyramimonas_sp.AAC.1